ncbi:hypothetical protein LTR17_006351 [Elasticomyces elasticus]|nr:hypothetical protein LTR17_006351 [Elasticomyces elasticus]
MSSLVKKDLNKLSGEIVTAIKKSTENMSKEIVAQAGKLDIREQILANARALWPVLEAKKSYSISSRTTALMPDMEIVVVGAGTTIYASVIRSCILGSPDRKYVFMRSDYTDSVEKSITKLLELTMVLLEKEFSANFFREQHDTQVDVAGQGHYY